ncbi:MAG: hypothetical protein P9L92_12410 [Candidatus Electryonea clarkiae]|nr:hypothetical protein [Candidatus Electryonea clarkiae]MDP8287557.1 hypothetical protein [Candidatus Electryonea clarkiae]
MKKSILLLVAFAVLFSFGTIVAGTDTAASRETENTGNGSDESSIVFLNKETTQENIANTDAGYEEEAHIKSPLFPSKKSFDLRQKMSFYSQTDEGSGAVASVSTGEKRLNPGRAVMMSAIIPGAGEFFLGYNKEKPMLSYLKSGLFFSAEVGFWYGAISYAMRGEAVEDDYEIYADDKWNEDVYRGFEYWLAKNYPTPDNIYPDDKAKWRLERWEDKLNYLPTWFTHELPEEEDQQYYEMIGKYLQQFGIAWDGAHDNWIESGANDPFYRAYLVDERHVDYANAKAFHYGDMRYESNQLLDASAAFFMAIMVNHVMSALDAGFSVRIHNRELARAEMGFDIKRLNGEEIALGGLRVRF